METSGYMVIFVIIILGCIMYSDFLFFFIRILRKLIDKSDNWRTDIYCQIKDQNANDYILSRLNSYDGGGFMLSKWGTIELSQVVTKIIEDNGSSLSDLLSMVKGKMPVPSKINQCLYYNAGVFPCQPDIFSRFSQLALEDCQLIDILGSYISYENKVIPYMNNATRINLNALYAPWLFKNPWTQYLENKKVLVVHPFVESIRFQYENNRGKLFDNPDVLPQFKELICIKAINSQGEEPSAFDDWFSALNYMECEIDRCDFDVAIIGCGAYGMSLAAHVKRHGKIAIHLAGWTQMLFGVYGERWVSQQPEYSNVINEYWKRPFDSERIKNLERIEEGCYW